MNQTTGYNKRDLDDTFSVIAGRIRDIDDRIRMMEEQGAGLRTNLDWASTSRGMFLDVNPRHKGDSPFNVRKYVTCSIIGANPRPRDCPKNKVRRKSRCCVGCQANCY